MGEITVPEGAQICLEETAQSQSGRKESVIAEREQLMAEG